MLIIFLSIIAVWTLLTLWVEKAGAARHWSFGDPSLEDRALVIFDPDPFYNLDEQVCTRFARSLAGHHWYVDVRTTRDARLHTHTNYALYVFCANTYNWAPDWSVSRFIRKDIDLHSKKVVAITLGAGSTKQSMRKLENMIRSKSADLIQSRTFWLLRPNDDSRMKEKNVQVALSMVDDWAAEFSMVK